MTVILEVRRMLENKNRRKRGVNGPRQSHVRMGWKRSSLQPYAYFSHRASSSYTVSDTPSLKPAPAHAARRMMYPLHCRRSDMSKSSETWDSDQNLSYPSSSWYDTCWIADHRRMALWPTNGATSPLETVYRMAE